MFPRIPLAVPYWTGGTYRASLRSIFSGAVIDGADAAALRCALLDQLGIADAVLCGSGSLALEIALRVCGVRQDDEVVIPTFCCSAVVLPIRALNAIPVLADIGAELNLTADTVAPVLTKKTKAVVVPHLFGNPAEIGVIVELAREKNISVIDDAAQALGATIDGVPVGSFGEAGILSFGAEKVCFGVGGGAVIFRKSCPPSEDPTFNLTAPALSATLRHFSSTLVWRRWRRWTYPLDDLLSGDVSRDPQAPAQSYRKEHLANLNAAVALTLVQSLPENIVARRVRARAYRELLADQPALELIPHRPGSACLTQVARLKKKGPREDFSVAVIARLKNAGYEVQGSYVPIHLLGNFDKCVWDRLPYADRVWSDLIELPCEPDVSLDEVEKISALIKAAVASYAW